MAPVNPEGQTARDLTDEEIANGEQWIAALTTGPVRYPEMKIDCSLLARLLAEVKRRRAVRPSEEQTAQEVRRALEATLRCLFNIRHVKKREGDPACRGMLDVLIEQSIPNAFASAGYEHPDCGFVRALGAPEGQPPAAPPREERDRLAEELETAEARLSTARGQAEAFAKTAREARAKVAERDARIATLENELRGVLRHVEREAEEHAQAAIKIRAALGVPEENT